MNLLADVVNVIAIATLGQFSSSGLHGAGEDTGGSAEKSDSRNDELGEEHV